MILSRVDNGQRTPARKKKTFRALHSAAKGLGRGADLSCPTLMCRVPALAPCLTAAPADRQVTYSPFRLRFYTVGWLIHIRNTV